MVVYIWMHALVSVTCARCVMPETSFTGMGSERKCSKELCFSCRQGKTVVASTISCSLDASHS